MVKIMALLLAFSRASGYPGIIILMAIESSFIPFPSEVVVPPAAYLASQGELNVFVVVIAAVVGSLIGATFNYALARYFGRQLIYKLAETKYAKMLLISPKKLEDSEKFFLRYGGISTFIGRLVPAVRQLISLPAGFVKMNFSSFLLYTFFGSASWSAILAYLGYAFGANKAKFTVYYHNISVGFVWLFLILAAIMFYKWRRRQSESAAADQGQKVRGAN